MLRVPSNIPGPNIDATGTLDYGIEVIEMQSGRRKTRQSKKRLSPVERYNVVLNPVQFTDFIGFLRVVGADAFEWEFCPPSAPYAKSVHICKLLSELSYRTIGHEQGTHARLTQVSFEVEIDEIQDSYIEGKS